MSTTSMTPLRLSAALLATLSLSGCIWAPGQHLRSSDLNRESSTSEDGKLELIPITPKLIAMNQAADQANKLPAALFDYKPGPYRIGAGDSLYITIWDHPELTVPAGSQQQSGMAGRQVQADGSLFYPYIGQVQAEGMTPMELRDVIAKKLTKYIEAPQVDVAVLDYASHRVWVTGAAQNSTTLALNTTPITLNDAIGKAGLNPAGADLSGVKLTRDGVTYRLDLETLAKQSGGQQIYLKANDNIYVPYLDRKEVFVVGEVGGPGAYSFRTGDISLTQALGRARGLLQTTASGNSVYVIRGSHDLDHKPSVVYQLEARSPAAFAVGSQFQLQPGDVVFVGAAGITRWNRFIAQLLPFSNLLYNSTRAATEVDDIHN